MEKLELKHLAFYLPYKLEFIKKSENDSPNPNIRELDGLQISRKSIYELLVCFDGVRGYDISQFKPILRPLSDLVKPCLSDEKIPIVELAKITLDEEITKLNVSVYNNRDYYISEKLNVSAYNDGDYYIAEYGNTVRLVFNKLSFWTQNGYGNIGIANYQFQLFEKLFEWHFDIYKLIENDLAVDVNTLNL